MGRQTDKWGHSGSSGNIRKSEQVLCLVITRRKKPAGAMNCPLLVKSSNGRLSLLRKVFQWD